MFPPDLEENGSDSGKVRYSRYEKDSTTFFRGSNTHAGRYVQKARERLQKAAKAKLTGDTSMPFVDFASHWNHCCFSKSRPLQQPPRSFTSLTIKFLTALI